MKMYIHYKINFDLVINEFEIKTHKMNNYVTYMKSMGFLEMLNFCLKEKIKCFYKSKM